MLRVAVLGSTGSIGRQTLRVAAAHPDHVRIVALAANHKAEALADQAASLGVTRVALADVHRAETLRALAPGVEVLSGPPGIEALASDDEADVVLNALVGAVGLRASVAALTAGKRLALANKESLVAGGELVTSLGRDRIVPVDSEHSAIHQCLLGEPSGNVARLWLTASGGPFRGMDRQALAKVTVPQALAHPTWTMGPKITIDSATLMNKGLEVIEAHHLFGVPYERIRVVVHPQSCMHSMVEFADGSVKAHLGTADMRVPIQYALSGPERWAAPVPPVDFGALGRLDFEEPDTSTFRALPLAFEAGRTGGTMPAVLNAANEVCVAAFLASGCALTDIDRIVETVMEAHSPTPLSSVEQVEHADAWAREKARLELSEA